MAKITLLLLVFLASSQGGTTAQDCQADIVVNEGQRQRINTKDIADSVGDMRVYGRPHRGFEGIRVELQSDGAEHTAWFTLDEKCFPPDDEWQELKVYSWIYEYSFNDRNRLDIGFRTGTCKGQCEKYNVPPSLHNLSVVAYGSSKWITGRLPGSCHATYATFSYRREHPTACLDSPPTTNTTNTTTITTITPTTTTSTTTTSAPKVSDDATIITAVSVGGAVVVVALAVVTCSKGKSKSLTLRQQTPADSTQLQDQSHFMLQDIWVSSHKLTPEATPPPVVTKEATPDAVSKVVTKEATPDTHPPVVTKEATPDTPSPVVTKEATPDTPPPVITKEATPDTPPPVVTKEATPDTPSPVVTKEATPDPPPPVITEEATPDPPPPVITKEATPDTPSPVVTKEATPDTLTPDTK